MEYISNLTLSHFRSHKISKLSLDGRPVVVFGKNGTGKTNILEAVSLFSPGRGLRRATAEDIIKYLEEEEYLDTESFRYLEPIVRKEIVISNRELYTFKVQVKEEYRKYLKPKI